MTIIHKFDAAGGFTAGDTVTGNTCYAYPTSTHAVTARRRELTVARVMMEQENAFRASTLIAREDYDYRNWRELGRDPDFPQFQFGARVAPEPGIPA